LVLCITNILNIVLLKLLILELEYLVIDVVIGVFECEIWFEWSN